MSESPFWFWTRPIVADSPKKSHSLSEKSHKISDNCKVFKFTKDKVFCDLAKINAAQLKDAGIKNIDICQFKTYKDNEFLFSYRRENKTTSRISMVIKLA